MLQMILGIAAAILTCIGILISVVTIGEFPFAIWVGVFIVIWVITFVAIRKRMYNMLAAFTLAMLVVAIVSAVFFAPEADLPPIAGATASPTPDSP